MILPPCVRPIPLLHSWSPPSISST